jgi:hypothetical protein
MVGNILKWGCGTLLVVVAFIVIVGIAGAILLPDMDKDQSPKEPHEEVLNPKEEPVRKPEPKEESKSAEVEADARAYYDAAARGDYDYTYEHLTEMDRMSFSQEDWTTALTKTYSPTRPPTR